MQGYKNIGEILANARQDRHWLIRDVAASLHIRPRYLEALEAGDLSELPPLPYVKGYITRYADYLGLDREEILRRFEEIALQDNSSKFFMPHTFSHDKRVTAGFAMKSLGAAAFALVFWAFLMRPTQVELPLVEPVPPKPAPPPSSYKNIACMQPQQNYYPPCIWPPEPMAKSIMVLLKE